ncbi:50S ribosomal protein L6 [Iodidimonas gelatinilytica]|uniref:Large ribosomal subunit protein uL6 n=1 Tax=Iodidimonas gelatinilytica TaxID=1236966 RepID=A0A5A7MW97_9PROT|nr:50S ribosomal protein L6 [Iodidimonas gelatinilytica]GEQ99169.1 50S ribosomal protein L6 [Iodidimonas gelatinilytica]GER01955.1 50S ribosomal protein L6 [Iodidimonas gelatinilytica]
MSRIGKKPIEIPSGVTVSLDGAAVSVKGPKGELAANLVSEVSVSMEDNLISVVPVDQSKRARSMWGMQRTLVSNLIEGVSKGFEKKLEITGVGYRAQVKGSALNLQLGFSHDIDFPIPDGIDIKTPDQTTVVISGTDKQKVGQVAAVIRSYRKPEPYKGKGVRYSGEYIFRKEGKKK